MTLQVPTPRAHAIGAFLETVAVRPDAAAIWTEDGAIALSRKSLSDLISRTGHDLAAHDARPGDRVILIVPQGPATAVALMALSAYLPVAPVARGPLSELKRTVDRLKPRFLAMSGPMDEDTALYLVDSNVTVLSLSPDIAPGMGATGLLTFGTNARSAADAPPLALAGSAEIALILPTSGTTGHPKLVALTHAHLGHMAQNAAATLGLSAQDICVNPMPMHHIHGIAIGTFLPLASGGSIVPLTSRAGAAVIAAAERTAATWYTAVPTIHQDVIRAATDNPPDRNRLKLRFARSSSSALAASTRAGLLERIGIPVFEGLGMTEGTSWLVHQPAGPSARHGTVGRGQGVEVALLDAAGRIVNRTGGTGELIVRGPNVITQYLDSEDDGSRFVDGWLRTGDRVCMTPSGEITVIGRLKELINRGGATIAPVEIEETLLAHPAVTQAMAFGVPHPTLGQELAAAVVLRSGQNVDGKAIRRWLHERLTPEKLPRVVLTIEALPLNAVGKPERIRAAAILDAMLRSDYQAPSGALEAVLADMIGELLARDHIGRTEDIFLAGADSLMLVRLQMRIEELFGIWHTLDVMAENPTIATLAEHIARNMDPETQQALEHHWAIVADEERAGTTE